MLFYHTNHVIKQQVLKERKGKAANFNDNNSDDGLE